MASARSFPTLSQSFFFLLSNQEKRPEEITWRIKREEERVEGQEEGGMHCTKVRLKPKDELAGTKANVPKKEQEAWTFAFLLGGCLIMGNLKGILVTLFQSSPAVPLSSSSLPPPYLEQIS